MLFYAACLIRGSLAASAYRDWLGFAQAVAVPATEWRQQCSEQRNRLGCERWYYAPGYTDMNILIIIYRLPTLRESDVP